MSRPLVGLLVAALALTACAGPTPSPSATAPATTSSPSSPSSPSTTTATPSASATPTASEEFARLDRVVLNPPSAFAAPWREVFALPYGDARERLGTSLGGDGEGITVGPSYGTQLPDGTWWFLDAAHKRLAQFSDTGQYLGEVVLPPEHLGQGQYFQYQLPQALADGTLVLSSTTIDSPALLLMAPDRSLRRVPLAQWVGVRATDGTALYGFDENDALVKVAPATGAIEPVTSFAGQTGDAYTVAVDDTDAGGSLAITRPGVTLELPVTAASDPSAAVHPRVEVAMGADGVLALLVVGMVEQLDGEAWEVSGLLRLDKEGRGTLDSVRDFASDADPGDGLRLGVRLGDSRPWLMAIDPDAVRVYRRG